MKQAAVSTAAAKMGSEAAPIGVRYGYSGPPTHFTSESMPVSAVDRARVAERHAPEIAKHHARSPSGAPCVKSASAARPTGIDCEKKPIVKRTASAAWTERTKPNKSVPSADMSVPYKSSGRRPKESET